LFKEKDLFKGLSNVHKSLEATTLEFGMKMTTIQSYLHQNQEMQYLWGFSCEITSVVKITHTTSRHNAFHSDINHIMYFIVFLFSFLQITDGIVQILNYQLEHSSSSPSFFARSASFQMKQSRRLEETDDSPKKRDPYAHYYPADITEAFVKKNRCVYPPKRSREILGVEYFDDLFKQMLRVYDGGKQLHHKSKFMGIRMGQFPFDLQVMTEVD
jgi:hypothetical protein